MRLVDMHSSIRLYNVIDSYFTEHESDSAYDSEVVRIYRSNRIHTICIATYQV